MSTKIEKRLLQKHYKLVAFLVGESGRTVDSLDSEEFEEYSEICLELLSKHPLLLLDKKTLMMIEKDARND